MEEAPADEGHGERPSADDQLARVESVTDVALTNLDLDDLLVELLDRALEALDGDTAVVLLVDASGRELVARAARGLEEEVRQGVRVPIGYGFAGRVAAQRQPVILDRVDPETVWNPILWERGIRAMLGVPLLVGNDLLGVLHVGALGSRRFTADDVQVLELAADRIATATRVAVLEHERAAAETLQRSLLPSTPDRLGELEFCSRYVASGVGGVGGDWYDVFNLADGTTWIVVGDVAGHGFRAAVVMSRVRSALRAFTLMGLPPAEVLELTDRKVLHFEVGQMVTIAVVRVSADFERADVVLAGHPPPVLTRPGSVPSFVEVAPGLPVGVAVAQRPSTEIDLPVGASLFMYTDGLIERRGEPLDVGLDRLLAAVTVAPPATVCAQVMAALVGTRATDDDIAILAVRRTG